VEMKSETALKAYQSHLALVTDPKMSLGGQIHLHGPVTQTTRMARTNNARVHEPDTMEYFALMGFASVEAYGAYLASEEYGEMVGKGKGDGGVKSSLYCLRS
jgi:hypothetical protein